MSLREEQPGSAFILNIRYNGRMLVGLVEQIPGSDYFTLDIPGVCDAAIHEGAVSWEVVAGTKMNPALLKAVGQAINLTFFSL